MIASCDAKLIYGRSALSNTWDFGNADKGTQGQTPPAGQPMPQSYGQQPGGYGQPVAQSYGQQPGGYGGPKPPNAQGLAVASMVLGIVSIFLLCFWPIAVICAITGLSLGGVALSKINKGVVPPDGKGMAIAGVTCSLVGLAISVVVLVFVIVSSNSSGY